MKRINIILKILFLFILFDCVQDKKPDLSNEPYKIEKTIINDSISEYIIWDDSLTGNCYTICNKKDTLNNGKVSKSSSYLQYVFMNGSFIEKIKLFVNINGNYRINEIIKFNKTGDIDEKNSFYINAEVTADSIKLLLPGLVFNRTRIVSTKENTLDWTKWKNVDTLYSFKNHITLSRTELQNKTCILSGINYKEDSQGKVDETGMDFYFEINNLLIRDVKKTLLAK